MDKQKELWIIANWKSNKTVQEALEWILQVGPKLERRDNLKVVVCPQFSAISEIKKEILVNHYPLMVGAQDLSPFPAGAYTGEESALALKQFIDLAILGHSERRQNFKEDDELIAKKVAQAKEQGIIPLVCVQGSETKIPEGVRLVAYEPIWAISTGLTNTPGVGKADTPEDANQIAEILKQKYGKELEVIYGGSVNSQNVKGFVSQKNIAGVLVGNASLDAEEFKRIVEECCKLL